MALNRITIEVHVGNNEDIKLGLEPKIRFRPCTFDPNFLMYYILYEETIGFMIGGTPFSCERTSENSRKLADAFDLKFNK